jgi:SAM-dependent methyltransferase
MAEPGHWLCVACGGQRYAVVIEQARDVLTSKPGQFEVVRCLKCGLHSTSPVLNAEQLAFYYQGAYSNNNNRAAQTWQTGWLGRWLTRYRLAMIARVKAIHASSNLLDIGCGYGGFVLNAHALTQCRAYGLDNDSGSIAMAQQAALQLPKVQFMHGDIGNATYADAQFDVVCFFQSLEHHLQPQEALQKIKPWLKPGGLCVIEVPNFAGLWRHVFGRWWLPLLMPQHRVHYTPHSLRAAADAAGLQTVLHRGMFFPTESTASLLLWLNHRLGRPIRSYRLSWYRPLGGLLLLMAFLWWLLLELPVQLLCWPFNRTGHQILIAKKPD